MGLTHHDGVSVYGSGYYFGRKGAETPLFGAGIRADAGSVGFSGAIFSVSTKVSSIIGAVAGLRYAGTGGADFGTSGQPTSIYVNWSGHAIDLVTKSWNTSANTSAPAASSYITWMVFGT